MLNVLKYNKVAKNKFAICLVVLFWFSAKHEYI